MTSAGGDGHRFGPLEVHASDHRVLRGGKPVALPARHVDVLLFLVSNTGATVPTDAIAASAWPDVAVADNSVERVHRNVL